MLPWVYPILDAGALRRSGISIDTFGHALRGAGINFLQYRDKDSNDDLVIQQTHRLREIFPSSDSVLILNDRAHLLKATEFDGLHIGQEDLAADEAREEIGQSRILGLSTHNAAQLTAAAAMPVDYIAIGPIFGTQSKENPDPVVGLAGVAEARALTQKPLVAIGGITLENAQSVIDAGADSIALISALMPAPGRTTAKVLADFLARIG